MNILFCNTVCSVHTSCWLGQCHGLLHTDGPVHVASCVCSLAAVEGLERRCAVRYSSEDTEQVTFMLLIHVCLCKVLFYGARAESCK